MGELIASLSVVGGLTLLTWAYLYGVTTLRHRRGWADRVPSGKVVSFLLGIAATLIALRSPLEELSHLLFTAHMIQHLLLTVAMPVLVLAGLPDWLLRPLVRPRHALAAVRSITHPVLAFAAFHLVFALAHLPAFYDRALTDPLFHVVEHLVFIVTSLALWWPILSPLREVPALRPPLQMLYLFVQTVPTFVVGAMITHAEQPISRVYAAAPRVWGLDPLGDQRIAGLLMWVGLGLFYLLAITVVFFRWALREEARDRAC